MGHAQIRPRARIEDYQHAAASEVDAACYVRPTVEAVARLWDSHGYEAVMERWAWIGRWALERMAADGRRVLRAKAGVPCARGPRRSTTPEQEQAAFEHAMREGVHRASLATGIRSTVIYRILRERGVTDFPRLSREECVRASREGMARYRERRAAA